MSDLVSIAVAAAAGAHQGQTDKQGEPVILHPLRVMASVTRAWRSMHPVLRRDLEHHGITINHIRAIAVLHDVVEDTDVKDVHLRALGFGNDVLGPLGALTRGHGGFLPGETYDDFISRCALNPVAIHVKLLDLTDNMNRGRGKMTIEQHESLLRRYTRAKAKLEAALYERIEAET